MQVDGSYSRQVNGVFLPAGLLQRPFFSAAYPPARNYGSVGAVMGHELTHGFDNVGRRYDEHGRLHNWCAHSCVCVCVRERGVGVRGGGAGGRGREGEGGTILAVTGL